MEKYITRRASEIKSKAKKAPLYILINVTRYSIAAIVLLYFTFYQRMPVAGVFVAIFFTLFSIMCEKYFRQSKQDKETAKELSEIEAEIAKEEKRIAILEKQKRKALAQAKKNMENNHE
ncbi:hypothetical protein RX914_11000 [Pseudomonas syringae pv. actinidiae]|nr:hypothetical protein [Pseudomonas syringae pv. actinidiae]MDU8256601.1 hypothetical protein [Pseudomonas syringae pv. actinidiae]MDU8261177.1 hypothetical protein [Pseudomonas syringae pv. actinidiae]MDU8294144.1 hypothetical protein [Pseudomonas syringae pv. actinidiae]MDU8310062.1 hypothetical protein [Pseudomonas syringae pv. actinidiae]